MSNPMEPEFFVCSICHDTRPFSECHEVLVAPYIFPISVCTSCKERGMKPPKEEPSGGSKNSGEHRVNGKESGSSKKKEDTKIP